MPTSGTRPCENVETSSGSGKNRGNHFIYQVVDIKISNMSSCPASFYDSCHSRDNRDKSSRKDDGRLSIFESYESSRDLAIRHEEC